MTAVWGPKALENVLDISLELDVGIDRLMAKREGLEGSYVKPYSTPTIAHTTGHKLSKSPALSLQLLGAKVDLAPIANFTISMVARSTCL